MSSDVWDLTKKEEGDCVLIALTVEETKVVLQQLGHLNPEVFPVHVRAREEIAWSLRDQKGIEL